MLRDEDQIRGFAVRLPDGPPEVFIPPLVVLGVIADLSGTGLAKVFRVLLCDSDRRGNRRDEHAAQLRGQQRGLRTGELSRGACLQNDVIDTVLHPIVNAFVHRDVSYMPPTLLKVEYLILDQSDRAVSIFTAFYYCNFIR